MPARPADPEGIKAMKHQVLIQKALVACALIATVMTALPVHAGSLDRDRKGLFLGLNAGLGGASFKSKFANITTTEESSKGAMGALRFGYAFSNSFALSLEGYGIGFQEGDQDWGLGAGLLTVTWWPDGSGFFLRLGFGGGGGDILRRSTGKLVHFEDAGAARVGLGYEWQLGRKFALGLTADGIGFDLEGASGLEDDFVGLGTFSIQFNWYL